MFHEVFNRRGFDTSAVLNANCVRRILTKFLRNALTDSFADFLGLFKRRGFARADSPNRFVSNNEFFDFRRRETVEVFVDLTGDEVNVGARFTDFERFAATNNRSDARVESGFGAFVDAFVRFAEIVAAFECPVTR